MLICRDRQQDSFSGEVVAEELGGYRVTLDWDPSPLRQQKTG